MNKHSAPRAGPNTFNGEAISWADREFLASLGDHPLARHPLYSVPPPPRPDYDGCTTVDERGEAQKVCFPAALDWMLVNYAYYTDAFMGKGGIISLVDGKIGTTASLRGFMQPYTIVEEGPRGGLKKTSVVDVWMMHSPAALQGLGFCQFLFSLFSSSPRWLPHLRYLEVFVQECWITELLGCRPAG